MLSKSVCILLPIGFLLLDALVLLQTQPTRTTTTARSLAHWIARSAAQKIGFLTALLVFAAIALWSNEHGAKVDTDVLSLTPTERVFKSLTTPAWAARHLLWPTRLRVHYQLRDGDLDVVANLDVLLSVLVLLVGTTLGVSRVQQRQSPHLLLALLYYWIMLLPVSGLVQHGIVTQGCLRYAYFPSTVFVPFGGRALATLCVGGVDTHDLTPSRLSCRLGRPADRRPSRSECRVHSSVAHASPHKHRVAAAYLAVLCALVCIATLQMEVWRDEQTLYAHSLRYVVVFAYRLSVGPDCRDETLTLESLARQTRPDRLANVRLVDPGVCGRSHW